MDFGYEKSDLKFAYGPRPEKKQTMQEKLDTERKRDEWFERQLIYYSFQEENSLAYDLKKGEIYEIDWGMNINAEFSGRHYGLVIADSAPSNPLVLVCPLKTNHKTKINRWSDYFIGEIPGLEEGKNTVAVLNQTRAIDKMRIFTKLAIGPSRVNLRCQEKEGEELEIIRLDKFKVDKIVQAIARIVYGLPPFPSPKQIK